MMEMGHEFFHTYVPEAEHPMLDCMNHIAYKALYNVPVEHRRQCMLSFDFHLHYDNHQILVNHKSTPMALTPDGDIWLVMAVVSISSHKEAGHIEFYKLYSHERLEYSLKSNSWKVCEPITLSPEEQQALTLSAQGYTMKEIAEQMLRSFDTIKFYRKQVFRKLGVQSVTEAVTFATNCGLI
jgi:DNA-binding CsgD family transcriptional regulator